MVRKKFLLALLLTFFLMTGVISASVIYKLSLDEVLQGAELVFEGRVISIETRLSSVNGYPFTYFTFEIIEIIKGSYEGNEIELGFMGGPKDGLVLRVSDMHMPKMDEKGIYFVESLTRQQVNPLHGWHQGHYLIAPDPSGGPGKVVPVISEAGALITAPTVDQFKQTLRDMLKSSP